MLLFVQRVYHISPFLLDSSQSKFRTDTWNTFPKNDANKSFHPYGYSPLYGAYLKYFIGVISLAVMALYP